MEPSNRRILQGINKNVKNKKWPCLHKNCENIAINSHFIQVSEITKHLAINKHVYQLEPSDIFKIGNHRFDLKLRGVNEAFSLPLYCNKHDDELFSEIEKNENVDHQSYRVQLQYSLRATANELRRKEIVLEKCNRLLTSNTFSDFSYQTFIKTLITPLKLGVQDLEFYHNELIAEIESKNSEGKFLFKTYYFKKIAINVCGLFSPIDYFKLDFSLNPKNTVKSILVTIFPNENQTIIILGYYKKLSNNSIDKYINEWNEINMTKKLSDLITTKMNSWCISPHIYNSLSYELKSQFLDYWDNNVLNLSEEQKIDFDLFVDC